MEHVGHRDGYVRPRKGCRGEHTLRQLGPQHPAFDVQTGQVDNYAWSNLKFLPMFAAGNDGEEAEANTPRIQTVKRWTYTDGRGTLGNPTNAKNCVSIGAALSDNSEPIDNSMLATKFGDYWDNRTDWTWQVDIGGSEGTHWSSSLIRGFGADATISAPSGGDHSLDARCGGRESGGSVQHAP